ncbi:ATP-binding protein, partial [Sphingomonas sp. 179-A 4D3 NHS]|uniref:ATP-binding protein n=1 Tax=Sphingomonas sp. 179-A 4D3 NHS TaxID=3374291 RepID=UPI003879C3CD
PVAESVSRKSGCLRAHAAMIASAYSYGRRSTLVTSQLPVARWFDLIGDPTYADAILDRLVHNAHRLELSGESMRRNLPAQAA